MYTYIWCLRSAGRVGRVCATGNLHYTQYCLRRSDPGFSKPRRDLQRYERQVLALAVHEQRRSAFKPE